MRHIADFLVLGTMVREIASVGFTECADKRLAMPPVDKERFRLCSSISFISFEPSVLSIARPP